MTETRSQTTLEEQELELMARIMRLPTELQTRVLHEALHEIAFDFRSWEFVPATEEVHLIE